MDLPRNAFKHALASGRTQFGAWLMSGAPSTAEAMGCSGFDFLVVDMEHVPVDVPQAIEKIAALSPDVLLLDIQMPGGSGFDVLEQAGAARNTYAGEISSGCAGRPRCVPSPNLAISSTTTALNRKSSVPPPPYSSGMLKPIRP